MGRGGDRVIRESEDLPEQLHNTYSGENLAQVIRIGSMKPRYGFFYSGLN